MTEQKKPGKTMKNEYKKPDRNWDRKTERSFDRKPDGKKERFSKPVADEKRFSKPATDGKKERFSKPAYKADNKKERAPKPLYIKEDIPLEGLVEGRHPVLEAYRSGRTVDKLFLLDGCKDGIVGTILREANKQGTIVQFVDKERLDSLSETKVHQGVIARVAAYSYVEVEDILARAKEKQEEPFIVILDEIEDPYNLGSIIRTASQVGAHGVIIPKHRSVGITPTVAKASAGAVNYVPVAKTANLSQTIEALKKEGLWFVCADMDGTSMYQANLKGPIGLVIGNEGKGVGRLVKEKCDSTVSIPMKGEIDSLNASVAFAVLAYEIVRQRG